jgi:UDP-N-acetylmuramyl pentapeptide phosphotransferase/UDP-N-acetylglucosamine-1-phosphate transferase
MLLLFLGGLKDDLVGLRYRYKFLFQIIASIMIVCSGLYINNFHGILGIYAISPWIGMPLTVVVLVFIINSVNFIDGIDGLSAGIGIMALSVYCTFFLLHDLWHYAVTACCLIGALCAFFYYNVFGSVKKKRKLFMGDSGSMTLGLVLGFLMLQCMREPLQTVQPLFNVLVISISPLLLPIFDVLRVVLSRIKRRKHLFTADRYHIHHKLLDMGINKSVTMIALLWVNSCFCFFNFIMLPFLDSPYIFLIDAVVWIGGNMLLSHHIKKRRLQQIT